MALIIISGILTAGIIPILAALGFGISLIVNIFTEIEWGYWHCAAVGFCGLFVASFISGLRFSLININKEYKNGYNYRRKENENQERVRKQ